mgnify:CR=1 FL=1
MRLSYITIPLFVLAIALLGNTFTVPGLVWFDSLVLPAYTPPSWVFGFAWSIIYILATIGAILLWKSTPRDPLWQHLGLLLVFNGFLNIFWTELFFYHHLILQSLIEMVALNLITLIIILLGWKRSRTASLLFVPYFLWVSFATYLTYGILMLN